MKLTSDALAVMIDLTAQRFIDAGFDEEYKIVLNSQFYKAIIKTFDGGTTNEGDYLIIKDRVYFVELDESLPNSPVNGEEGMYTTDLYVIPISWDYEASNYDDEEEAWDE